MRIKLVAYSREYNHATDIINKVQESSTTASNSTDKFVLNNKGDVSVAVPDKELSVSKNNQYVSFEVVQHKDKTQNMVPFIDSQKVESTRPTRLSGAGLYLEGQPGHEASLGTSGFPIGTSFLDKAVRKVVVSMKENNGALDTLRRRLPTYVTSYIQITVIQPHGAQAYWAYQNSMHHSICT